jgi:hypothetical protein
MPTKCPPRSGVPTSPPARDPEHLAAQQLGLHPGHDHQSQCAQHPHRREQQRIPARLPPPPTPSPSPRRCRRRSRPSAPAALRPPLGRPHKLHWSRRTLLASPTSWAGQTPGASPAAYSYQTPAGRRYEEGVSRTPHCAAEETPRSREDTAKQQALSAAASHVVVRCLRGSGPHVALCGAHRERREKGDGGVPIDHARPRAGGSSRS